MSVRRLTTLPQPFLVNVVTDRTPEAAIATMRGARFEGAHAHELNLPALADADPETLRAVIGASGQPVYTSFRRSRFMTVYGFPDGAIPEWDDDARMERQIAALRLGAVAIDMELDTFDPSPAPPLGSPEAEEFAQSTGAPTEFSIDPTAVSRQRAVIAAAHEAGGEVILSCHTGRPQTAATLVDLIASAESRGADLIKIVTPCRVLADLLAVFEATVATRARTEIPFTIAGAGPVGQLSRSLAGQFGASWVIGQLALTPGGFHPQPLLAHLRETMRLLPWRFETEERCE